MSLRLLIAEDDAAIRESLAAVLRDEGHDLELAVHGVAAERALRASRFDLLLLDLGLPFIDGDTLLAHRRGDPLLERTPVLVLTGDAVAARRLDSEGVAVLLKPFRLETLLARIADLALPLLVDAAADEERPLDRQAVGLRRAR